MGTRVAPTYAIIYMNNFENNLVYNYVHRPPVWRRLIDDIWGIFRGTEIELLQFFDHLNSIHPTLKFTHDYSKSYVTFLDVTTYRDEFDNRVKTKLFVLSLSSNYLRI